MYFVKTPVYLKRLFSGLTWDVKGEQGVFLTFDDGPVEGVTDRILDILHDYGCKATFFCIGDNVRKHPALFQRILSEGHQVGNHTFHHVNGWKTNTEDYLEEVAACNTYVSSELFRPPYGRINLSQMRLLQKDYRIVMWDVLSADFDTNLTALDCANLVIDNVEAGSIVVFHDSEKAAPRVLEALPIVLEHLQKQLLPTICLNASQCN
jgi:peptidoglycan-N-acetylglucosamine deacetylase